MKQQIYFAHGSGFPSPCYHKFLNYLSPFFVINYVDKVGHDPNYPVTDNWDFLAHELIQNIEQLHDKPVIGVGHSLGGILHFMASYHRPDLYRAVVMLDSPVFSRTKSMVIRLMKWTGYIDKITPAGRTKHRKESWASADEAIAYFKTKPLFAHFDIDCLHDYVKYGMDHSEQGVKLRFDREVEYHIHRTLPHNLTRYQHQRSVPTGLLYGKSTKVVAARDIKYMNSHLHIQTRSTLGGHLFPFEHPAEAAIDLIKLIRQLGVTM